MFSFMQRKRKSRDTHTEKRLIAGNQVRDRQSITKQGERLRQDPNRGFSSPLVMQRMMPSGGRKRQGSGKGGGWVPKGYVKPGSKTDGKLTFSKHAAQRARERGITPHDVDMLICYGDVDGIHQGGYVFKYTNGTYTVLLNTKTNVIITLYWNDKKK